MTDIETHQLWAVILATFPGATVQPSRDERGPVPGGGTSGAYRRSLQDLDYPVAEAAVQRVSTTFRFSGLLPSIAEFREAALALAAGEVKPGLVAWGEIQKLHARFSTYRHPTAADVPDPIAWEALQSVGWRSLCMAQEGDPAPRARFVDAYDRLAAAGRREAVSRGLPAVRRLHELRAAERQAMLPEAAGLTPIDQRTPRELNEPVRAGDLASALASALTAAAGGQR